MDIQHQTRESLEWLGLLSPHIPVLTYHHIAPDEGMNDFSDCAIGASQFERQMRYLHDRGYRSLDLTKLFYPPQQESFRGRKVFALTFDDGFDDFFTQAYPILQHYGFTSTVFLVTDLIGGVSNWEGEKDSRMLTWGHIEDLSRNRISFGSHTCTHSCLLRLPDEQIRHELSASKECIEAKLRRRVSFFAYPFGESNQKIQNMVRDAGYHAAFGVVTGRPGRFNLWRCHCKPQDNLPAFSFRLTWLYSFLRKFRGWLREETSVGHLHRKIKHRLFSLPAPPLS